MNAAELIAAVTERCPEAVSGSHAYRGDATVTVAPEALVEVARTLKEDESFSMNFLMDLTAVDYSTFGDKGSPAFFASPQSPAHEGFEAGRHCCQHANDVYRHPVSSC